MEVATMRTRTKAKIGGTSAKALVESPALRKASAMVAPPAAKAGLRIGRRRARKRALVQAERLQEVARSAGDALTTYGPQAAEALGLIEPPKPRRTPVFAAGAVLGAAVALLLEPKGGAARRARLATIASSGGQSPSTPPPTPASTAAASVQSAAASPV
jgi:hypothetical protein